MKPAPVQQIHPSGGTPPVAPVAPDGRAVLHLHPPRPGWTLRARIGTVGMLCGRVPAGHASTAAQAVAWWADRHPEVALDPAVVEARAATTREGKP